MGRDPSSAGRALTRVVRVVPDVPSFSVDDGFSYSVPEGIDAPIGALVRVPLGGRRVRGWVVGEGSADPEGLKQVLARSGDLPVFDKPLLEVMRWAAVRYVAPLSTILSKATPPNLPRAPSSTASEDTADRAPSVKRPTEVWWGRGPWAPEIAGVAEPALDAGRGAMVVAPTVAEGEALAAELGELLGDRVVFTSSADPGAEQTAAWVRAATRPGTLLVGTRTVALWPLEGLGLGFVIDEGRRGMKDKATPATHARELLVRRSQIERFGLVLCGLVPTAEALARGAPRMVPPTGRPWGHVEIVDRRTEDSIGSLLGTTARAALRSAAKEKLRVLLFTHRRATAERCVNCRELRRCPQCGSGSFVDAACRRCGADAQQCHSCGHARFEMLGAGAARVLAEAGRVVGRDAVGEAGSGARMVVGTERDLPGLAVDLTIVVDGDGPILAPTYRAGEDALRLMARAVAAAGTGRGRRGLIQTSNPEHPVFEALRRADPVAFVQADGAARAATGFPPGGELLVLEAGDPPEGATADLADAIGDRGEVLGPADAGDRVRWLVQGADLTPARIALRALVARWREGGARVRVDADPVDL